MKSLLELRPVLVTFADILKCGGLERRYVSAKLLCITSFIDFCVLGV